MSFGKRGISSVITTVLLILIVVVCVGILSIIILALVRDISTNEKISANLIRLDIVSSATYYQNEDKIYFEIKRNENIGNLTGMKIIVNNNQKSEEYFIDLSLDELETGKILVDLESRITNPSSILIFPIIYINGKFVYGLSNKAKLDYSINNVPVMICGNGIIESENEEECDDGNLRNGDGCSGICKTEIAHIFLCSDGIDNDGDLLIDYPNDPGCLSLNDNDENNVNNPIEPKEGTYTKITISDDIILSDAKKLGIVIGQGYGGDNSIKYFKNILPNPGLEGGEFREVVLTDAISTINGASELTQFYWSNDWNNPDCNSNLGKQVDFWNEGSYEIVSGNSIGEKGKIVDFYFGSDNKNKILLDKIISGIGILFLKKEFKSYSPCQTELLKADATTIRPLSKGNQSLKMSSYSRKYYYMDSFWRDSDTSSGKQFLVNGNWKFGIWAKANTNGDELFIRWQREDGTYFFDKYIPLTTSWQYYEYNFNVEQGLDNTREYDESEYHPIISLYIENQGSSDVWIDDLVLEKQGQLNPTPWTDDIVNRLKEYNPGVIRYWGGQLGTSIESQTSDPYQRVASEYRTDLHLMIEYHYGLNEFLLLCKEVGADPWFVISPTYNDSELNQLVEFLSGPISTNYGARRAALGHLNPWTDDFDKIYIEFSNEAWGSSAHGDPFKGGTFGGGVALGFVANRSFDILKKNPYYNENKIKLIIGGQHGWPMQNKYIEDYSSSHDILAIAPYYNPPPETSLPFNDEYVFSNLYAYPLYSIEVGRARNISEIIIDKAQGTELAIYEINYHTNGDADQLILDQRNKILTGQAGGIVMPLNMLTYMKYLGIKVGTSFTLTGYSSSTYTGNKDVKIWGMVNDISDSGSKRGSFIANEVANKGIYQQMFNTSNSGLNPFWNHDGVYEVDGQLTKSIPIPYIQSFSFKDGNKRSIIIFNLHRTDELNITLSLAENPSSSNAVYYQFNNSDLYATNEDIKGKISYETINLNNFANNSLFSLPPHSINTLTWNE